MNQKYKVLIILPRNMDFSIEHASSIDLVAYDFARHSVFSAETVVCGMTSGTRLPGIDFVEMPAGMSSRDGVKFCVDLVRRFDPRVIVVHQHIPTAVRLCRAVRDRAIILHRHNYIRHKRLSFFKRIYKSYLLNCLDHFVFVSDSVRDNFTEHFGKLGPKSITIHNFLDFSEWNPNPERRKEIVFAGRCVPEKGVLEAVRALEILKEQTEWRAKFILSRCAEQPDYAETARRLIAHNDKIDVLTEQPFHVVKRTMEHAAIALVPSLWNEPFGRTALEAHAGGAAVISSGRGGLREVSGDFAVYVDPTDVRAFSEAIHGLMHDASARDWYAVSGHRVAHEHFSKSAVLPRYDRLLRLT
ncbi:glycosyltransferase family 4 protein [Limibaculum sp. FT325]|uniref:glycosyltransferase family 4 protein n=1 Tax=Thermohalobaculum sediminis TaxID=2939436 RepID=UPI0020C06FEE|nr:glycosyltransferase family 4 protein [Limibaculum sediminis]MCL5777446.1 glycosyltransferase family 4 protein [Limibaculum sediminis]